MLNGLRVLDLTNENGMFCGYLLAHLGAEVIALEPPGGSSARQLAPFDQQTGAGLWWEAYAQGKQSVVVDMNTPEGAARFITLVSQADVLLESSTSAEREQFGLTYEALKSANPALICVAITPFGMRGPKAEWPATDLTVWAASGTHNLAGDADRAPVRTSVPQTFLHAGADAAVATLLALRARDDSGLGQQVDVSAQQSCAQAALSSILSFPSNSGTSVQRTAGGIASTLPIRLTWPCADGYVTITVIFGPAFTEPNRRLLQWVHEAGHCGEEDVDEDWGARMMGMTLGHESPEAYLELCRKIEAFTSERTQTELFEEGLARGLYIAPTLNVDELLEERHFQERGFWRQHKDSFQVPGPFAKFSEAELTELAPAPGLGESIGFSSPNHLAKASAKRNLKRPLEDLKVLDFTWVMAGPLCTRVLADYGASVIKVESTTRMEPARTSPPFKDGQKTPEHSVAFMNFNNGKMSVTIDPSNSVGREVILDLVRWADVVVESYSPKAMKDWGLDYAALKEVNPDLIMLSSCLMGHTGPRSQVPGYGNMAAAVTGFYELTGWPDRSPAGPYLAYTDGVAPRFMLISLLAALEHRDRRGVGQYIDLSQAEAAIHMLGPAIFDYGINQHVWSRDGNRDLNMCPHGVYPVAGDDKWIALTCASDEHWGSLKALLGDVLPDDSLDTLAQRKACEDELDSIISAWTQHQGPDELQTRLINAGIPAHVVNNSETAWSDPQFVHREHFVTVSSQVAGEVAIENTRFHLQGTPAAIDRGPASTGEHNVQVLMDVLGYDGDKVADVLASLCME